MFGGHYGYVAIVSERYNRTPNYEVSNINDVKPDRDMLSRHFLSHSAQQSKANAN